MRKPRAPLTLSRTEPEQLTLDGLAACTGVHPALITYFVGYGLLKPSARTGTQWFFDTACIARLRMIERLRRDLGANLGPVAGIWWRHAGLGQAVRRNFG